LLAWAARQVSGWGRGGASARSIEPQTLDEIRETARRLEAPAPRDAASCNALLEIPGVAAGLAVASPDLAAGEDRELLEGLAGRFHDLVRDDEAWYALRPDGDEERR